MGSGYNDALFQEILRDAEIVWEWNSGPCTQLPDTADFIFVLGSNDVRVAEHAAKLYHAGLAPLVVFSGASGALTKDWGRSEAEVLADIAEKAGVPRSSMLLETKATNTGENCTLTYDLLRQHFKCEMPSQLNIIAVQKPYMMRRTHASILKQWPGTIQSLCVSSDRVPLLQYDPEGKIIGFDNLVNGMVGDTQRCVLYGRVLGFQEPAQPPDEVMLAYARLVALGYASNLVKHSFDDQIPKWAATRD